MIFLIEKKKIRKKLEFSLILAVFRIRIRLDPYHLTESGSTSGNVDPDPVSKKNRYKLTYKSSPVVAVQLKQSFR